MTATESDEAKLRTAGNDEVEGLGDAAEMVDPRSKRVQPEGTDSVEDSAMPVLCWTSRRSSPTGVQLSN